MAEFNEAYWVAAATAAPVIGLAHAVVLGQYLRLIGTKEAVSRSGRWGVVTYFGAGVGFVLAAAGFLLSMLSLGRESNGVFLIAVGVFLVVSLWLVAFSALSAVIAGPREPQ